MIRASDARQQKINEAEGQASALLAVASATAEGLRRVAEQYINEFGKVINNADTIVLPANVADVASMITTAMNVVNQQKK